jgi:hypothetical protein
MMPPPARPGCRLGLPTHPIEGMLFAADASNALARKEVGCWVKKRPCLWWFAILLRAGIVPAAQASLVEFTLEASWRLAKLSCWSFSSRKRPDRDRDGKNKKASGSAEARRWVSGWAQFGVDFGHGAVISIEKGAKHERSRSTARR